MEQECIRSSQKPLNSLQKVYSNSRNPYAAKLKDSQKKRSALIDFECEAYQGKWLSLFKESNHLENGAKLHVEIGCNAGHVLTEWAKSNPKDCFVGIDWKFKAIFRAAQKCEKASSNIIFLRAYAERLEYIFAPGEIDCLYLFFPDPWPKRIHHKNRFLGEENLKKLAQLVKPGGTFWIKTDHQAYFEGMLKAFQLSQNEWKITSQTTDLHINVENPLNLKVPDVTIFEKLFIRSGLKICSLKATRSEL